MRWFAALFLLNLDLPSRPTQVDWELEFNRHRYAPWLLAKGCDRTTEKICPLFLFVKKGHMRTYGKDRHSKLPLQARVVWTRASGWDRVEIIDIPQGKDLEIEWGKRGHALPSP